ncbi:hypothetical protein ACLTEW_00015 [Gordonia lacunae]|uniref:hypothetical protein n=1 Tax=Gordonia lacunae TaxID=417102 RepID=UPI0039E24FE5
MSDVFAAYHRELADIENAATRRIYPGRSRRRCLMATVTSSAILLATLVVGGTTDTLALLTNRGAATPLVHIEVVAAAIAVASSVVALTTEKWSFVCGAFSTGGLASSLGLFGFWSQNTLPGPHPTVAPLFIGLWLTIFATTTLWAPLAVSRPITSTERPDRPKLPEHPLD